MSGSPKTPLMLSVSGARGIVGDSMTPTVASAFAGAFGSFVKESAGRGHAEVCVGRDPRPSSEMLSHAACAGLTRAGCIAIDLGVVATPTVAVMIGERRAAGGMVITASHNPVEWNGLKCLSADGTAPPQTDVDEIVRRFRACDSQLRDPNRVETITRDDRGDAIHVEKVLAGIEHQSIRSAKLTVVLDSVNGAGCVSGRMLLQRLGCEVVHLNGEPTGRFTHGLEPLAENLTELAQCTATESAAYGFAQDPDADRLAIVDENGRYIGEEYTLVLAARRLLDLQGGGPIVANLSTSRMIDDLAARYPGATVIRTPVGEAHVAAGMNQAEAMIGGEGNGGVIFPPVCGARDSLSAMALVLGLVAAEQRPLSAIVADLPSYAMIKQRVELKGLGHDAIQHAVDRVATRFADQDLNTSDGVRVDFDDGWVHLRPSNTEPIVRLIAEANTRHRAQNLIDAIAHVTGLR